MHLDDERLQRLLDGELTASEAAGTRVHLAECGPCRERAAAAERELAGIESLLRLLDHPVVVPAAAEFARAARPRWGDRWRWAAAAAVAVGLAGAAYAAPASPLPRWIAAVTERLSGREAPAPVRPTTAQAGEAGIAVSPGDRLLVAFDSVQAAGEVVVTVRAGAEELTLRGPSGAAGFATGPDRVRVANAGSRASYAIEIPGDAPWVEVRVGGTRLFLKDGPSVTLAGGADSAAGSYRIPLHR